MESFTIFQGKVKEQYDTMIDEFGFHVVDATKANPTQQEGVRKYIDDTINLSDFIRRVVR